MSTIEELSSFVLDTTPLSRETRQVAELEIRETPELVQNSLAELRALLKGTKKCHCLPQTTPMLDPGLIS